MYNLNELDKIQSVVIDYFGYMRNRQMRTERKDMLGITKVYDRLYVGSAYDATDDEALKNNNINVIVNVSFIELWNNSYIEVFRHPLNDNGGYNSVFDFMDTVRRVDGEINAYRNVLLNCISGINRSVSVATTVIAKRENVSFNEALEKFVKPNRWFANPHPNLVKTAEEALRDFKI